MTIITNLWVCVDCARVIANGDYEGLDDETAETIHDAVARDDGRNWVLSSGGDGGGVDAFSWSPCDCCGSTLGGARYRAAII
jgi:hypothetical protein